MKSTNNKQQRIDVEVERTLQSLDSLEGIEAQPYFQTRLQQAIREQEREAHDWLFRLTRGYRLVPVALSFFVLINIASLALTLSSKDQSADYRSLQLQEAAREFSFSNWSYESSSVDNQVTP